MKNEKSFQTMHRIRIMKQQRRPTLANGCKVLIIYTFKAQFVNHPDDDHGIFTILFIYFFSSRFLF